MAADGAGSALHAPELGAGKKLRQKALRVCVLCVCSVVQCGPTLCDPKDYSLPGSSVHGVFQARTLEWVCHFLLQGIFLTQGVKPVSPALADGFFTTEPPGKHCNTYYLC